MPATCPRPEAVRPPHPPRRARARVAVLAASLVALAAALFATPALADVEALKKGSRGEAVVQLQRKLGLAADGVFGPRTHRAVRRYQARNGLTVDGVVGQQTAAALGLTLAHADSTSGRRVRVPAILEQIAQCESGGNPRAISPGGTYRGKYQFDRSTWAAYGPPGDPAKASETEQDRRALALYKARGNAPWPNCP